MTVKGRAVLIASLIASLFTWQAMFFFYTKKSTRNQSSRYVKQKKKKKKKAKKDKINEYVYLSKMFGYR